MTNANHRQIPYDQMQSRSGEAEAFLKQLANAKRLMILCALQAGELSVGELNERVPLSQSALSQHLAKLRSAGFVSTRRVSQTIYYRIADQRVLKIIDQMYLMFCNDDGAIVA